MCLLELSLSGKCECSGGEEVLASFLPHPFDHHHGHGKKRAAVPEPEAEEGSGGAGALSDEAMVEKIFAAMDHDREHNPNHSQLMTLFGMMVAQAWLSSLLDTNVCCSPSLSSFCVRVA